MPGPWEIADEVDPWSMIIRWGLAIVVLIVVVRVFFWRRSDFRVRVRAGRVEHKGLFPRAHRSALDELLLRDLAIRGPVSVYGVRKQRRWQLWFRGSLCEGDKQRIRNFIVTRLGSS